MAARRAAAGRDARRTATSTEVGRVDQVAGERDRERGGPIVEALVGDTGRCIPAASLLIALGLIMGYRAGGGPPGVVAAVALVTVFAVSLSWAWTALGLVVRTPNAVMSVGSVILFPLTLLSNIFVAPATMPSGLRAFAEVNPVSRQVTAVRGLMDGTVTAGQVLWVLAAAALLSALFAPLTAWLHRRRA